MTNEIFKAISYLQGMVKKTNSQYSLDRYERALDELVRHHEKSGDPQQLAHSAWRNAGIALKKRSKYLVGDSEAVWDYLPASASSIHEHMFVDILNRSIPNERYRKILQFLYEGLSVEEIALREGATKEQVRVWISRARAAFRLLWEVA